MSPDEGQSTGAASAGEAIGKSTGGDTASGERPRVWRRRLLVGAAIVVGVAGPMVARVAYEGRAELRLAAAAAEADDVDGAILHYGRAARWRVPLFTSDDVALVRLDTMAAAYEAQGDDRVTEALLCLREIRRAILSTRHLWVPDRARLEDVNGRIATLMASQEVALGMVGDDARGSSRAWHLERLTATPGPQHRGVAALASLCFLGWIVAAGGFLLRGLDARGRLRPRLAVRWGAAFLLMLVGWVLSVGLAG